MHHRQRRLYQKVYMQLAAEKETMRVFGAVVQRLRDLEAQQRRNLLETKDEPICKVRYRNQNRPESPLVGSLKTV